MKIVILVLYFNSKGMAAKTFLVVVTLIGHFRVPKTLTFSRKLSPNPFL